MIRSLIGFFLFVKDKKRQNWLDLDFVAGYKEHMKTKPASKRKLESIRSHVEPALYRKVMAEAEAEGRTQSNMVAKLVEEALAFRQGGR